MGDTDVSGHIEFTPDSQSEGGLAGTVTVKVSQDAADLLRQAAAGPTKVTLQRSEILNEELRKVAAFFGAIRNRTGNIGFAQYNEFVNRVLCEGTYAGEATCGASKEMQTAAAFGSPSIEERRDDLNRRPGIYGVDAYQLLRLATEAFLIFETGIVVKPPRDSVTGQASLSLTALVPNEEAHLGEPVTFDEITQRLVQYLPGGKLPYLRRIVNALFGPDEEKWQEKLPYCDGILRRRFSCPSLLELIWSYWHEEGMLVQTLNAIALRFQNRRSGARDPLANLEIDPLRPLNNLFWGYIQDETHRLTLRRRAYEYDHHYGLTMYGKAVPKLESADSRSKFLEAFHNLLHRTAVFYREDADTTVIADAFPLLNALREVHLLLAEGAHNQFGDLPWTARLEMLIQQWLLSRPEIREFLRGRAMVPYQEPWMGHVDTMKKLQGWTDVTVTHFHELAVFGEQILLSIRYHDWIGVNDPDEAKIWARYWKAEIQRYIHSYLAVTGVDLEADITDTQRQADRYIQPSVHLRNRLAAQRGKGVLPGSGAPLGALTSEVMDLR